MKLSIEDLLLNKNFSNLSFEEREFVLSKITKAEYNDIRFIINNSEDYFKNNYKEVKVNDTTKKNLSIAFKLKHQKQKAQPTYINYSNNYKKILRPVIVLGIVLIGALISINISQKKNDLLSIDIKNVSTFLNENNKFLKINTKYSSDLIDSNKFSKDSIFNMNNYLNINTEGLFVN